MRPPALGRLVSVERACLHEMSAVDEPGVGECAYGVPVMPGLSSSGTADPHGIGDVNLAPSSLRGAVGASSAWRAAKCSELVRRSLPLANVAPVVPVLEEVVGAAGGDWGRARAAVAARPRVAPTAP